MLKSRKLLAVISSLVLAAFGASLAGVAGEIYLRYSWPSDVDLYQPDPVVGWVQMPNARGWISSPGEYRTLVEINSEGLRGKERTLDRPLATPRILVLGDSFTQAVQVPLSKTFCGVLEEELNTSFSPRAEVLNAGVGGYSTAQEYLYFRTRGFRHQPSLVLLTFLINNDTLGSYYDDESEIPRTKFRLTNGSLEEMPFSGSRTELVEFRPSYFNSLLLRLLVLRTKALPIVATVVGKTLQPKPPRMNDIFAPSYSTDTDRAWALTEELIKALRKTIAIQSPSAKFAVVIWPDHVQYDDVWWQRRQAAYPEMRTYDRNKPERVLTEILTRQGIPYLSLTPSLRDATKKSGHHLFFQADAHPTEEGHRVAALAIKAFLEAGRFLDTAPAWKQKS